MRQAVIHVGLMRSGPLYGGRSNDGMLGTTSHNLGTKTVSFRIVVRLLLAHDPAHEHAHLVQSTSVNTPFEGQSSNVACYTGMGKGGD
jgi:hypothetical protein